MIMLVSIPGEYEAKIVLVCVSLRLLRVYARIQVRLQQQHTIACTTNMQSKHYETRYRCAVR